MLDDLFGRLGPVGGTMVVIVAFVVGYVLVGKVIDAMRGKPSPPVPRPRDPGRDRVRDRGRDRRHDRIRLFERQDEKEPDPRDPQ